MTYIITEPCVSTCDTACLEVCPVDCIHGPYSSEGSGSETRKNSFNAENNMLYINPEQCIDCGACEPECPVDAIFSEESVPDNWSHYIQMNYGFFGIKYNGQ